jgi:HEXXH motif-containing protein
MRFMPRIAEVFPVLLREDYLWSPGLAATLAGSFRTSVGGLTGTAYGTERWLRQDAAAPRNLVGTFALAERDVLVEVTERGMALTFTHDIGAGRLGLLAEAGKIIAMEATLAETLGCLVRVAHVLRTEPAFDISHSDPEIPFSVFVSVPAEDEPDAVLRLAESIVHEAMHLQLTLLEATFPIVGPTAAEVFSPWQRRRRPIQGLVHGLYVFAVVSQWFQRLVRGFPSAYAYTSRRRREIAREALQLPVLPRDLTPAGEALWARCRAQALSI